jgi:hypothetical protein
VFNVDEITAYAMATDWTPTEFKRLREYADRILDGRRFRLRSTVGPKRDACRRWEEERAAGGVGGGARHNLDSQSASGLERVLLIGSTEPSVTGPLSLSGYIRG